MINEFSLILRQVSVDEATCHHVQSLMVSGAAVVGGSTWYCAAPRAGSTARPRTNVNIIMKMFWGSWGLLAKDVFLETYY